MGPKLADYWPFIPQGLPIYSYGFTVMLGFLTGLFFACRRARKLNLSSDAIVDMAFWAFLFGLIGARAFYVMQFHRQFFGPGIPLWKVFAIHQGGLVFYGAFLTATGVLIYVIRRKNLPLWRTLDILASVVMIGLAFGRIGCFSRGCCWGVPTQAWWGVVFPPDGLPYHGTGVPAGTPLVPTQLVSSFNAFVIFVIASLYFHHWRRRDGEVVVLVLALYPVHRFLIEFWRADTAVPGSLSIAQWISIVVFLAGTGFLIWMRSHPAPTPQTVPSPDPAPPRTGVKDGAGKDKRRGGTKGRRKRRDHKR